MSLQLPTARRALLWEVAQRLPAGRSGVFRSGTGRGQQPVSVTRLEEGEFYEFEEPAARAFGEAVIEWAARVGGGRLTVTCPGSGEFRSHRHRWHKIAARFDAVRLLTLDPVNAALDLGTRVEAESLRGHPLRVYRLVLHEGKRPVVFVARYGRGAGRGRREALVGFFSFDSDVVGDVAEDVEAARHGAARDLGAFVERELVHLATVRVGRELKVCRERLQRLRRGEPVGKRTLGEVVRRAMALAMREEQAR